MFFSPMVDPKWPPKWPSGGQPWDQLISLSAVKKQKFSFPPSCSGGRTFVYFEIRQVCTFPPQMEGTWVGGRSLSYVESRPLFPNVATKNTRPLALSAFFCLNDLGHKLTHAFHQQPNPQWSHSKESMVSPTQHWFLLTFNLALPTVY